MPKSLAVIGCGPKAAALAAKAGALKDAGYDAPVITIYETVCPGAAWSGVNGYTNGTQRLCTPAERDMGFPYARHTFGRAVADFMSSKFSWKSYCINHGNYDRWLAKGRRPPRHLTFANYIDSVVSDSGASLILDEVTKVDFDFSRSQWVLESARGGASNFDGVVVTGSGEPHPQLPGANQRVFDGKDFWTSGRRIVQLLKTEAKPSLCIIGAGGTAAAIAGWLGENGLRDVAIRIVGSQPALHGRGVNYFEDRLFTEDQYWRQLSSGSQVDFLRRISQGVVWQQVLDSLRDADLTYLSYRALGFSTAPSPAASTQLPPYLMVDLAEAGSINPSVVRREPATVFVDARGFNALWFVGKLISRGSVIQSQLQSWSPQIHGMINESLAVEDPSFPAGLHLPMLGSRRGPAANNLMALGWMSDQILRPYIPPSQILHLSKIL